MTSNLALEAWALPQLKRFIPLDDNELIQIVQYTTTLSDVATVDHLQNLLGDSPQALQFATSFNEHRTELNAGMSKHTVDNKQADESYGNDSKKGSAVQTGPETKGASASTMEKGAPPDYAPPGYAPPPGAPPANGASRSSARHHTNQVIEAGKIRAHDEQEMQQMLQSLQLKYGIYNSDIEPEHETDYPCSCPVHQYQRRKWGRYGVQKMWSKAVMYPGEKAYDDNKYSGGLQVFNGNPYMFRVVSPYGYYNTMAWGVRQPNAGYHARSVHQTIELNNSLNRQVSEPVECHTNPCAFLPILALLWTGPRV